MVPNDTSGARPRVCIQEILSKIELWIKWKIAQAGYLNGIIHSYGKTLEASAALAPTGTALDFPENYHDQENTALLPACSSKAGNQTTTPSHTGSCCISGGYMITYH